MTWVLQKLVPHKFIAKSGATSRQEGFMTTECFALPAVSLLQLAREKASRRRSNLSLGMDMLVALALLAGIGLVLSIGSAAVELLALA
jgi:hypothetical protein